MARRRTAFPPSQKSIPSNRKFALGAVPFNRAIRELHAHTKAVSRRRTINHSPDLRKFPRQNGNKRFFTRPPGPLAEYTRTVGTDIFRECSLPSAGFF